MSDRQGFSMTSKDPSVWETANRLWGARFSSQARNGAGFLGRSWCEMWGTGAGRAGGSTGYQPPFTRKKCNGPLKPLKYGQRDENETNRTPRLSDCTTMLIKNSIAFPAPSHDIPFFSIHKPSARLNAALVPDEPTYLGGVR